MPHRYTWQVGDTLIAVAGGIMMAAGYTSIYDYIADIYMANPDIFDWYGPSIAPGTVIQLPWKS